METTDYNGAKFTPNIFIQMFERATKLAPARFLSVRMHPDRYQELYIMADIPKSIQLGTVPAPMGRPAVMKVNCIKPPMGVSDGITVLIDKEMKPDKVVFEIHGIPELVCNGLYCEPTPQSA